MTLTPDAKKVLEGRKEVVEQAKISIGMRLLLTKERFCFIRVIIQKPKKKKEEVEDDDCNKCKYLIEFEDCYLCTAEERVCELLKEI